MNRIKKILNSSFFRSIATLMSGTLIAQAISVIISPLMTRLYTEEQIGEYTLILTAVSMFGSVICGRYDMSIVGEKDDKDVYAIVKLSLIITIALSAIVSVGYTIYFLVSDSLNLSALEIFGWTFIFLLLTGVGHVLYSYNNRDREYKLMSSVQVTKEVGKATTLTGFGLLSFGTLGLLLSYLVSGFVGIGRQAKKLICNFSALTAVSRKDMIAVAKKHRRQPLYSVPAGFANSFAYSVINIFVERLFGTVTLAYYSMSFRMLGIPLSLVSVNTSKAYYEKAAREYDQTGKFNSTFIQTSLFLLAIAIPMVILLMLFAPLAFELFFGEGWGKSGEYVRYLAPMFGIRLIVGALTPTMIICNKQKNELIIQVLFIVSTIIAYLIGINNKSMQEFAIIISILFSLIYIVFYIYMYKLSLRRKNKDD